MDSDFGPEYFRSEELLATPERQLVFHVKAESLYWRVDLPKEVSTLVIAISELLRTH